MAFVHGVTSSRRYRQRRVERVERVVEKVVQQSSGTAARPSQQLRMRALGCV
jgi:hypothetical protein